MKTKRKPTKVAAEGQRDNTSSAHQPNASGRVQSEGLSSVCVVNKGKFPEIKDKLVTRETPQRQAGQRHRHSRNPRCH